jgi:hypothetical protein
VNRAGGGVLLKVKAVPNQHLAAAIRQSHRVDMAQIRGWSNGHDN